MSRLTGPSLFTILSFTAASAASGESMPASAVDAAPDTAVSAFDFRLSPPHRNPRDVPTSQSIAEQLKLPDTPRGLTLNIRRVGKDTVEQSTPDGNVQVRFSSAAGSNVFVTAVAPGLLSPANTWRNEAALTVSVPLGSDVKLSLSSDALNTRTPLRAGMDHGLGEPTWWSENKAVELAVKLSLEDDLLTYSGGFASSDYRNVRATRFTGPDDPLSQPAKSNGQSAYWQRLDLNTQFAEKSGLTAYAVLGDMGQDFRSRQRFGNSPLIYNGKSFETGGRLYRDGQSLTWSHRFVADAYSDTLETTAKLDVGVLQLSALDGRASYDFPLGDGEYQWATRYRTSIVRVSPARLGDGLAKSAWLPEAVTLRLNDMQRSSDGTEQDRSTVSLSLDWSRGDTSTAIGISKVDRQSRSLLAQEQPPNSEIMVDLNHSRTVGPLEVSAYGSIDVSRSRSLTNHSYTGGLSVSADVPLKWSVSVDFNSLDQGDVLAQLEDRGFSFSASADLTPYLSDFYLPKDAHLSFKAFSDWDRLRIGLLPTDQQLDPGAVIMFSSPLH